jgi:hypothetical protein
MRSNDNAGVMGAPIVQDFTAIITILGYCIMLLWIYQFVVWVIKSAIKCLRTLWMAHLICFCPTPQDIADGGWTKVQQKRVRDLFCFDVGVFWVVIGMCTIFPWWLTIIVAWFYISFWINISIDSEVKMAYDRTDTWEPFAKQIAAKKYIAICDMKDRQRELLPKFEWCPKVSPGSLLPGPLFSPGLVRVADGHYVAPERIMLDVESQEITEALVWPRTGRYCSPVDIKRDAFERLDDSCFDVTSENYQKMLDWMELDITCFYPGSPYYQIV